MKSMFTVPLSHVLILHPGFMLSSLLLHGHLVPFYGGITDFSLILCLSRKPVDKAN